MEIQFEVDKTLCGGCGQCVADCLANVLEMAEGFPRVAHGQEDACYQCQHCLAICPEGAVSVLGLRPQDSEPLSGPGLDPRHLETLIRGRRSVRRYRAQNLDPVLLEHLLEVAWYAPTGANARQVRFTVVDDREKLARLRDEVMAGLGRLVREGRLPEGMDFFADFVRLWEEKGVDILFRDAPHLLIASAPRQGACPVPDCLIALSYFELFAQSLGIGTVWNGLTKWAISDLLPETRQRLGIPEEHAIGYVMSFGRPALRFHRTVQRGEAAINRVVI